MALVSGARLGVYEVATQIGAGGMGEVYRARDTKLARDVAIKVLPASLAADTERVARFEREARALAALNHPNVGAIYGMEASDGVTALVLELVEGPTLADRLAHGPIAVDQALAIARQIAEALEAAHEKGIIHRDLKPANIKVRDDGTVKVLDFGLAKLVEGSDDDRPHERDRVAVSQSPTLSLMATQAGMILGTAAYMSPEQAEGKPADHRSDIFSFGSVLYELLTGRPAFQGDSAAAILASVLVREPDLTALPSRLNPRLCGLLKRCLEKSPRKRWQAVGDLRAEIDAIAATPFAVVADTGSVIPVPLWRRAIPLAATAIVVCALTSAVWWALRPAAPAAPPVSRLTVTTPDPADLWVSDITPTVAVTPDGKRIVYVGNNGTQIFVRALDSLEPAAIVTGAPRVPFISPDGQWVGFFDYNEIRKVPITGGPSIPIAVTEIGARGAAWTTDDIIIFATGSPASGLQRVSAAGGTPEMLTRADRARGEFDHVWPELLPGGGAVLFTIQALGEGPDASQVALLDLQTKAQTVLVRGGSHARYVSSSGHLVYAASGTLRAVSFDPVRRLVNGASAPVISRLSTTPSGAGEFALATDGTLIYVDPGQETGRTLAWVDRNGKEELLPAPSRLYVQPRISPDGKKVALYIGDEERDIWIWELERANLIRLTTGAANDLYPLWTPDSQRIIFASSRADINIWSQSADGTGTAEQLTSGDAGSARIPYALARDGSLVFGLLEIKAGTTSILRDSFTGERVVSPLVASEFDARNAALSPDDRWLAYDSDSSRRREVYVRPFPDTARQWQISTAGGQKPQWARSGRELFYLGLDGAMMRVSIETNGDTLNVGTPTKLFDTSGRYFSPDDLTAGRNYDVSPDGQRFLLIRMPGAAPGATPPSLIVVQNWNEELKRLVPTR